MAGTGLGAAVGGWGRAARSLVTAPRPPRWGCGGGAACEPGPGAALEPRGALWGGEGGTAAGSAGAEPTRGLQPQPGGPAGTLLLFPRLLPFPSPPEPAASAAASWPQSLGARSSERARSLVAPRGKEWVPALSRSQGARVAGRWMQGTSYQVE